jgi:hypothetical protein
VLQSQGRYEYEAVRSYQYTLRDMYAQFIKSDYGARQRLKNEGKDTSMKKFRELIYPCMTHAKQTDSADEILGCLYEKTESEYQGRDHQMPINRTQSGQRRIRNSSTLLKGFEISNGLLGLLAVSTDTANRACCRSFRGA